MRTFTIPGKPVGKGRPRFTRAGIAYTPKETKEYEKHIKEAYMAKFGNLEPFDGAVWMVITANFQIPKSDKKEIRLQKEKNIIRPTIKVDADNIAKIIMDGLNGIAYLDDKQVIDLSVYKRYATEPRVIVQIGRIK